MEIFLHLLINVVFLVSFLIVILPYKIIFLMYTAHHPITFVNFAKFVLLLILISLSFLLTLLYLQNLIIVTLFFYVYLSAKFLNRLQLVQNAMARGAVPSVRRNYHITPTLRQLHWLPIPKRVTFKIVFITLKTLHHKQPSYLTAYSTS